MVKNLDIFECIKGTFGEGFGLLDMGEEALGGVEYLIEPLGMRRRDREGGEIFLRDIARTDFLQGGVFYQWAFEAQAYSVDLCEGLGLKQA